MISCKKGRYQWGIGENAVDIQIIFYEGACDTRSDWAGILLPPAPNLNHGIDAYGRDVARAGMIQIGGPGESAYTEGVPKVIAPLCC